MTMPVYNLADHISWTITRRIPLRDDAVTHLKTMIANTYTSFSQQFAGITTDNSMFYIQPFQNILSDENFLSEATAIILPYSLLDFIELPYAQPNGEELTAGMITQLFNCLEMTPEFSGFITALNGITPANCQEYFYKSVIIYEIMACPKFQRDAQTFPLDV